MWRFSFETILTRVFLTNGSVTRLLTCNSNHSCSVYTAPSCTMSWWVGLEKETAAGKRADVIATAGMKMNKRNLYDWWGITAYILSLKGEDRRILLKSVTWKYSVQKEKRLFKLQLRLKDLSMWAGKTVFVGFQKNPDYWTVWQALIWERDAVRV